MTNLGVLCIGHEWLDLKVGYGCGLIGEGRHGVGKPNRRSNDGDDDAAAAPRWWREAATMREAGGWWVTYECRLRGMGHRSSGGEGSSRRREREREGERLRVRQRAAASRPPEPSSGRQPREMAGEGREKVGGEKMDSWGRWGYIGKSLIR